MTYKDLCQIADKRIKTTQNILPINSFAIAGSLGLRIKNSIEAKQDFKNTINPLSYCNACLTLNNSEYTIYYDEKYSYKNFAIAHEISHYLLNHSCDDHSCDGIEQHHDANLLASIIIAPKRLILINGIKSAVQLSTTCMIPFEVANEYWSELEFNVDISDDTSSVNDYLREIKSMFMDIGKLLNNIENVHIGGVAI